MRRKAGFVTPRSRRPSTRLPGRGGLSLDFRAVVPHFFYLASVLPGVEPLSVFLSVHKGALIVRAVVIGQFSLAVPFIVYIFAFKLRYGYISLLRLRIGHCIDGVAIELVGYKFAFYLVSVGPDFDALALPVAVYIVAFIVSIRLAVYIYNNVFSLAVVFSVFPPAFICLLYTSDAADER